eukprot:gene11488-4652_t
MEEIKFEKNKKTKFDIFNNITKTDDTQEQNNWKKSLLENEIIKNDKNSIGELIDDKIQISSQKGKLIVTMGETFEKILYLNPEECLYLVERKLLNMYYQNNLMTLEQIYSNFFKENKNFLNEYLVYSHLKNLGYIIKRHSKDNYFKKKIENKHQTYREWYKRIDYLNQNMNNVYQYNNSSSSSSILSSSLIFKTFKENEKINLNSISKLFELNKKEEKEEEEEELNITFDIFKSGGTRNQKNEPIYCLIIQNCLNTFPKIKEIKRIKKELNNTNILFTILDGSTVQLFLI